MTATTPVAGVLVVVVALLAVAVVLLLPRGPGLRGDGPVHRGRQGRHGTSTAGTSAAGTWRGRARPVLLTRGSPDRDEPVTARARLLASGSLGVTVALAWGGTPGTMVGLAAGAAVAWWLGRQEPPAVARRRVRLAADLPHVVDLFAALLRAGQGPASAAARVAGTAQGPAAEELAGVARRSAAGLDPYAVWRPVAEQEGTALLGAAMLRSLDSGARVVDVVERVAEELRRDARAAATAQARTVGVRATAPLAACFLPALVLVGVVPFVASLVAPLLGRV